MVEPLPFVLPAVADPAARLSFETALVAGRLAAFLRRVLPADESGALASGLGFLERAYRSAAGDMPVETWRESALERAPAGAPQPLDRLAAAFGLSPFEVDFLLLAGLAEEHEGFADVLRALHPAGRPAPTVGLAAQLFAPGDDPRREVRRVLETGPARRFGLFELDSDAPFFGRTPVLAEALWPALLGLDRWPARLAPESVPPARHGLEEWLDSPAARRAREVLACAEPATVLVTAEDPEVAFERAAALAAWDAEGEPAVRLRLPAGVPDPGLERLIGLHCILRGAVPVLRAADAETGPALLPRFEGHPGPVVVAARGGAARLAGSRPIVPVPCDRLGPRDLAALWSAALPALAEHAGLLAARYPVEPAEAREVAADLALFERLTGERLTGRPEDLPAVAAAVRARSGPVVGGAVQRITPTASWSRLVLPAARHALLREMVDRLLHQRRVLDDWALLAGRPGARGVRALFSGPPGTGKTYSAEVLAAELGVDLLVVDLSRVVSKWIGETEKNLAEVFASAERARAVLLFDEADALFGKRTEVSDAHDRYANLETAYLLARLERFEGLAILATNLRQNIDLAFTRRLEFVVDFDDPDRTLREALWRGHLPPTAPLAADVCLAEIAAVYPLSGGLIKNASVAAAFRAAADGRAIGRDHLLHAIRRECEKAGKAFPGAPHGTS
jgi:hypothetical protein